MSIVASYTREEWYNSGEWAGIEPYIDAVRLNFLEEADPESDVMPACQRLDPDTWKPWPQDDIELPDVPYRFYTRDDEKPQRWIFENEGADKCAHSKIIQKKQK